MSPLPYVSSLSSLELVNVALFDGGILGTGVMKHVEMRKLLCVILVDLNSITSVFEDEGEEDLTRGPGVI